MNDHLLSTRNAAPPVHGGDLARARHLFGGEPAEWIDFSNNVNPYGLPDALLDELLARAHRGLREYPDPVYTVLRRMLAARHDVSADSIWPFNGSVAALYSIPLLFTGRPVVAPAPSFREYAHASRSRDLVCAEPICFGPEADRDPWASLVPEAGLFILGTPNSPTGELLDAAIIEEILATAKERGTTVILDEAFLPFTEGARSRTSDATRRDDLIVLQSLTKTHGLPGLRLGYAVSSPAMIARLRSVTPPWSVGPLAEAVALALPDLEPLVRGQLAEIASEAKRFHARLCDMNRVRVFPSAANFFLCETPADAPKACELKECLCRRRLLIRTCGDYPGLSPRHFRIAVRRPEENELLLEALREELV